MGRRGHSGDDEEEEEEWLHEESDGVESRSVCSERSDVELELRGSRGKRSKSGSKSGSKSSSRRGTPRLSPRRRQLGHGFVSRLRRLTPLWVRFKTSSIAVSIFVAILVIYVYNVSAYAKEARILPPVPPPRFGAGSLASSSRPVPSEIPPLPESPMYARDILAAIKRENQPETPSPTPPLNEHHAAFAKIQEEQRLNLEKGRARHEFLTPNQPGFSYRTKLDSSANVDEELVATFKNRLNVTFSPFSRVREDLFTEAEEYDEDGVREAYSKLVRAYLRPFEKTRIQRDKFFDILRRRNYNLAPPQSTKGTQCILFQIVDSAVYFLDPYMIRDEGKSFVRTRIRELAWLLQRMTSVRGRIPDVEFLVCFHDCIQTINRPNSFRGPRYEESSPTFTIVGCNFSDNIPIPLWEGDVSRGGRYVQWDPLMADYASQNVIDWNEMTPQAVFRGGLRPSMYFRETETAAKHCEDAGRSRLAFLAETFPDRFNLSVSGSCGTRKYKLERLEEKDHHTFKYVMYMEGNCFWADRLNKQLFGPSAIIKQETPCGQFYEPLLRPHTHYIPTDFFLQDTVPAIDWAMKHDEEVRTIVRNANRFAKSFLTLRGIETYMEVLLTEFSKLLATPDFGIEPGSIAASSYEWETI
uniref:Glycosyl transferase CAP10 domain-containing protein n=1 Tax=Erythrolobus madagascarensis TaxID=708628 RepID=A0A7S0T6F7_9RHOD